MISPSSIAETQMECLHSASPRKAKDTWIHDSEISKVLKINREKAVLNVGEAMEREFGSRLGEDPHKGPEWF